MMCELFRKVTLIGLLSYFLLGSGILLAQQNTYRWHNQLSIGQGFNNSIVATPDGGCVLTGGDDGPIFAKFSSDGSLIIKKRHNSPPLATHSKGFGVAMTHSGNFVVVGEEYYGQAPDSYYGLILYLNPQGDIIWKDRINANGTSNAACLNVKAAPDSGFAVLGYAYFEIGGTGTPTTFLMKYSKTGVLQWTQYINNIRCYDFIVTNDQGYAMIGHQSPITSGQAEVRLLKVTSSGNIQWSKGYGVPGYSSGYDLVQLTDSSYVLAGVLPGIINPVFNDILIIRTNTNGDTLWTKAYGGDGNQSALAIKQLAGGELLIGGTSNGPGYSDDMLIMKTDLNGDTLWTRMIGTSSVSETLYDIAESTDGGIFLNGRLYGASYGISLIKTDSNGESGCYETRRPINIYSTNIMTSNPTYNSFGSISLIGHSVQTDTLLQSVQLCFSVNDTEPESAAETVAEVYPNPFTENLFVRIHNNRHLESDVEVKSVTGQTLFKEKFFSREVLLNNLASLQAGIYFLRVSSGNATQVMRIVKN